MGNIEIVDEAEIWGRSYDNPKGSYSGRTRQEQTRTTKSPRYTQKTPAEQLLQKEIDRSEKLKTLTRRNDPFNLANTVEWPEELKTMIKQGEKE